jgi:hypothetical protein
MEAYASRLLILALLGYFAGGVVGLLLFRREQWANVG